MIYRISLVILYCIGYVYTAVISISIYENARFDPIDSRYMRILSTNDSSNTCLCKCYNNTVCFTALYYGFNQTCIIYFAQLNQGQLQVIPTIFNATIYYFGNRSYPGKKDELV